MGTDTGHSEPPMDQREEFERWVTVREDASGTLPASVPHPCHCDAPDPETGRIAPLAVPVDEIRRAGRAVAECPWCDTRLLIVLGA